MTLTLNDIACISPVLVDIAAFIFAQGWIWISNRQNLRWSITSMSVLRCLWRGAQLRLKRRDTVCVHCRLGQRIPLWDGSYKEGILVLLSISRYVTELVVMLAAGSCICTCEDVIHWYCYFTVHYSKDGIPGLNLLCQTAI